MKRFHNMSHDDRRVEMTRRLPIVVKALRDLPPEAVLRLIAAAQLLAGDGTNARNILDAGEGT